MLCLPQIKITNPLAMHFIEATNLCIQMAPPNIFVQKESRRVSKLKGKYAIQLPMLIQAIGLKGTCGTYASKNFILFVALGEFQKLLNWAQVVFNNLHSRLQICSQ
jgi:hypothetical protein